jgi:hypothetical protein
VWGVHVLISSALTDRVVLALGRRERSGGQRSTFPGTDCEGSWSCNLFPSLPLGRWAWAQPGW